MFRKRKKFLNPAEIRTPNRSACGLVGNRMFGPSSEQVERNLLGGADRRGCSAISTVI